MMFDQNNQLNNNLNTDPNPLLPYYKVQQGDSLWSIAMALYPNANNAELAERVKDLASVNGINANKSLTVGQEIKNPIFFKPLNNLKKTGNKVYDQTMDVVTNPKVQKVLKSPVVTSLLGGSKIEAKKSKDSKKEEDLLDKISNTLKKGDKWIESKKEKGGGTQAAGLIVYQKGIKADGQDEHLAKTENLMGSLDWDVINWVQAGLSIEMPELQMTRSSSTWSGSKAATTANTVKGYKEDIDAAKEEDEKREAEEKQLAEWGQPLETMFQLYEELKTLGLARFGLQDLECSFPSNDITKFDTGMKVVNLEQVKTFIKLNDISILQIQFRSLHIKDGNDAGHLSAGAMVKILQALKAKGSALTLAEYKKVISQ